MKAAPPRVYVVYFPPNGDAATTVSHILDCLDRVTQKHPYIGILLCGDFNKLSDSAIVNYLLKQIVTLPTRHIKNILDKISSIFERYDQPSILPPVGASDHSVVLVCAAQPWRVVNAPHRDTVAYVRISDSNGKVLLAQTLSNFNWSSVYMMEDCHCMLHYVYSTV